MSVNNKKIFWWAFAIIFTIGIAVYQRLTGPTYPLRGNIELADKSVKFKLPRTNDSHIPAEVKLKKIDPNINGEIKYRKFKSQGDWTILQLDRVENNLVAYLPQQPPAGKLEYFITLYDSDITQTLTSEPVVIRFKGAVPAYILIPHIFFMFFAMLYSTRTGIEAIINGNKTYNYTLITLFSFLLGGMILGPIVQKYAFGDFWTGWPFGHDLTDNKTLIAFIAWIIAFLRIRKNKSNKAWVIVASIILLAIYLIPHSMFGSELDYSTGEVVTGE